MFKRIRMVILMLCMMVVLMSFATVAAEAEDAVGTVFDAESNLNKITVYSEQFIAGDINNDGTVNGRDTLVLKRIVVGQNAGACRFTVDVSSDGKINGKDTLILKRVVSQNYEVTLSEITTVNKQFDSKETAAKLTVSGVGENEALFDYSLKDTDLSADGYAAVVCKGVENADINIVSNEGSVYECASVEKVSGDNYDGFVIELGVLESLNASALEVKYLAAPYVGDEVYVDSVIFADNREAAVSFANERILLRSPEPESEPKYVRIDFDNKGSISDFAILNNMSVSYDSVNAAAKLCVSGTADDPWAFLNLDSYGISADEYKYVVITDMVPTDMQQPAPEGELFLSAGNVEVPTAGYSARFTCFKDSAFHSKIFELSSASFWNGVVHSLRFDFYTSSWIGDCMYIKSVVFCNNYEAAQKVCVDRSEYKTNVTQLFDYGFYDDGSFKMAYRFYVPVNYDPDLKYPVTTLLHGAGQRGNDGLCQITAGFPLLFDDPESDFMFTSIVLAPQCPAEYRWVETDWSMGNYSTSVVAESRPLGAVYKMLSTMSERYSVDTDRFYVSGLSMGGFGTWDLITRHKDMFAAAIPICGAGDASKASQLLDFPIHTFHGTADDIVPIKGTQRMYDTIVRLGGTKIQYIALEGYPHNVWDYVYGLESEMEWLFSQSLADRNTDGN